GPAAANAAGGTSPGGHIGVGHAGGADVPLGQDSGRGAGPFSFLESRGGLARFPRILVSVPPSQGICLVESGLTHGTRPAFQAGEEDTVMSCDYNGWNDTPE